MALRKYPIGGNGLQPQAFSKFLNAMNLSGDFPCLLRAGGLNGNQVYAGIARPQLQNNIDPFSDEIQNVMNIALHQAPT